MRPPRWLARAARSHNRKPKSRSACASSMTTARSPAHTDKCRHRLGRSELAPICDLTKASPKLLPTPSLRLSISSPTRMVVNAGIYERENSLFHRVIWRNDFFFEALRLQRNARHRTRSNLRQRCADAFRHIRHVHDAPGSLPARKRYHPGFANLTFISE